MDAFITPRYGVRDQADGGEVRSFVPGKRTSAQIQQAPKDVCSLFSSLTSAWPVEARNPPFSLLTGSLFLPGPPSPTQQMGTVHPPAIFISLFCSSYPPGSVQGGDRESAKKPEARARLSAHPFLQQREPSPSLRAKEGSSGWRGSLQSEAGWMQAVLAPNFPLCPLWESFLRRLFVVLGGAQDWESEDIGSVPSSATKKLGSSARP